MQRGCRNLLIISTVIVVLLSSCSQNTKLPFGQDRTDPPSTIVFLTSALEASQFWEERIAAFEADNPTIHVKLRYDQVSDDWPSHADVVLGFWPDRWPDLVSPGKALNLTPLIESDSSFHAADYYPGALDLYRQDGHTWAIPIGWSFKAIAYLPALFQEKSVPLPTSSGTWADVIDAARRLASDPVGPPCRSFADSTDLNSAAPNWLAERAGSPYLQQDAQIIPALDTPKMRQAMEDYIALAQRLTVLFDDAKVRTTAEILDAIAQGEAGLSIVDLARAMDLAKQFPEVALFPLPPGEVAAHEAERATSALFISAGSQHPLESWRWLTFVSQQNLGPYRWGDLPTRQTIAEVTGTWSQMSSAEANLIRATIANHAARPRLTGSSGALAAYNALWQAIGEVQYAHEDVAAALSRAQSVALATLQAALERNALPPRVPGLETPVPDNALLIEFQVMSNPEVYRQAATRFAAENPNLSVQISALGASPPCGCFEFTTLGSALEAAQLAEALETLNPLLEATRDLAPTAFFPDALAAVSWQDELYGIPVAIETPVLRFRPALFRALDLETPSASWTMEEVVQAAQKITDGGRGYFGLLPQPEEMDFVLNQLGISLFTSGTLPRPRFATPEVQTALERLMRLGGKTTAVPLAFEDAVAFVSGGRVAMWFEGTTYFQVNDGETEVVPIRLRSDVRFALQTTALGIAKNAEHVQECWSWITYLLHQGVHPSDGLSALRNQATLESAQPGPQQMHYAAALKTLQEMKTAQITDGPTTDWAVWWFTQAMREIAKGTEPMLALQTAQDKAEAFLVCLGPVGENDLDRAAQCARQVDPAHPLAQLQR